MTATTTAIARDTRGLTIRVGDRVRVTSYGWALRSTDVGKTATVRGTTPRGLVLLVGQDGSLGADIANGKAVHGECLIILDRTDSTSYCSEAQRLTNLALDYGLTDVGVPGPEVLEEAAAQEAHDARVAEAQLRSCDACNAEPGETCRPGCIGEAAHQDELEQPQDGFGDGTLITTGAAPRPIPALLDTYVAEQDGREKAAGAAVVVRAQLLSQPLLAPHLRDALEALCGFAEVDPSL